MRIAVLFSLLFIVISVQRVAGEEPDTVVKKKNIYPHTALVQFAGFTGMFSAGIGYRYWHERINTSFVYGYVPPQYATDEINTLVLKNTINLFEIKKPAFAMPVLYAGFTFNCEVSDHAFITLPDYYPSGYYGSQAIHFTFFGGLKAHIPLKGKKAIELYGEAGTLDSYLWYWLSHKTVDIDDIFKIALGVNFIFK